MGQPKEAPPSKKVVKVGPDTENDAEIAKKLQFLDWEKEANELAYIVWEKEYGEKPFEVGTSVEYWAKSVGDWLEGEVVCVNFLGGKAAKFSYDLDIKKNAKVKDVRLRKKD